MNKRWQTFISDQSGAMAVMAALLMTILLSAAALAVDYGYMAWVQGELQKAAEGGALAGASVLVSVQQSRLGPRARPRRPQSSNRIKRRERP